MAHLTRLLTLLILVVLLPATAWAQGLPDTDGDGLPDVWETSGVTVDGVFVNLPAMGADPLHKDLFVEIDFMRDQVHSHQPELEALRIVTQAFSRAPVLNPDGTPGIWLHLDAGPDYVMNPKTGATWGTLGLGGALPEQRYLMSGNRQTGPDWSDFQILKDRYFTAARRTTFRYCVFAHNVGQDFGTTSGWARGIPGTDFIVTLGGWARDVGSTTDQAGTFMHEMGHTIGLRHGGADHIGLKPNFLSVMNYCFQTAGIIYQGKGYLFDYSRYVLPNLDETNLDEPVGLNAAAIVPGFGTRHIVERYGRTIRQAVYDANGPIDWNDNGVATDTNLTWDVNGDGRTGTLTSFNDWNALVYAAAGLGQARAKGVLVQEEVTDEIDKVFDDSVEEDYEVLIDLSDDRTGPPGTPFLYTCTVLNDGLKADTYNLVSQSELGWSDFSRVPAQVSLAPGEEARFPVVVTIPPNAQVGQEEETHLAAWSMANPDLVDSITAYTTAGTPGAQGGGTGGTGGGGCFIATAAYGSYLDPHVVTLRRFRDERLNPNPAGRAFVEAYYRWSPPVAAVIARSPFLRGATVAALTPVVLTVEHPLAAMALLLSAVGLGWRARRRRRL